MAFLRVSHLYGVCAAVLCQAALAGPILDRILERRAALRQDASLEEGASTAAASLPAGVRLLRDVRYGQDRQQRMDIYLPRQAVGAPVIFMVHGGAWFLGDKAARSVVENKVARWVPQGFIFISVNYRLLPKAAPLQQAQDIARALAVAQSKALSWGADPAKFILMGHSAGAHLVALLAASPSLVAGQGAGPWLGTVALDSAALDVVQIMETQHARFYDRAFGSDPAYWRAVSPFHQLAVTTAPFLAVCSVQRSDSCPPAQRFIGKASVNGTRAQVLEEDLSHKEINEHLGASGGYTAAVEAFMASLDISAKRLLALHSN